MEKEGGASAVSISMEHMTGHTREELRKIKQRAWTVG